MWGVQQKIWYKNCTSKCHLSSHCMLPQRDKYYHLPCVRFQIFNMSIALIHVQGTSSKTFIWISLFRGLHCCYSFVAIILHNCLQHTYPDKCCFRHMIWKVAEAHLNMAYSSMLCLLENVRIQHKLKHYLRSSNFFWKPHDTPVGSWVHFLIHLCVTCIKNFLIRLKISAHIFLPH